MTVELLTAYDDADVEALAVVLVDCVDGGASVNFLRPLPLGAAVEWWQRALADPQTLTWVARDDDGTVVGCVRLTLAAQQNGAHRGEVGKMLVHRRARGGGLARELLGALESWAAEHGRTRLVLDTEDGSDASRLYEGMGWQRVGTIPDYARDVDGVLTAATFYTKAVG